jgi:hypothetical protein
MKEIQERQLREAEEKYRSVDLTIKKIQRENVRRVEL